MLAENRLYLSWAETAKELDLDSEGLRQWMRLLNHRLADPQQQWLRVVLDTRGREFLATLNITRAHVYALNQWTDAATLHLAESGNREVLLSDGDTFPMRDLKAFGNWDTTHDHRTGFSLCFRVSGDALVLSPETVSYACQDDGEMDSISVVPYDMTTDGFPDVNFLLLNGGPSFLAKPQDLFTHGLFLGKDVLKAKAWLAEGKTQRVSRALASDMIAPAPHKDGRIRSDREGNLLRVIAGLWALSGLPPEQHVTADKLSALFDSWGWDKPAGGTIAETILKPAAKIPGAVIRK